MGTCTVCAARWLTGAVRCVLCEAEHLAARRVNEVGLDGTECGACHQLSCYPTHEPWAGAS